MTSGVDNTALPDVVHVDGAELTASARPVRYADRTMEAGTRDRDTRRAAVRVGLLLVGFAVIVAIVLALPGVDDVRQRFAATRPGWLAVAAVCSLASMFGFVRALWAAFDRLVPWRQAVVLGFAEQAANVLVPAGGLGGPALGALVMRRAGFPAKLATERHAVLFLATSAVSFVALALAGVLVATDVLGSDEPLSLTLGPAAAAIVGFAVAIATARRARPRAAASAGRPGARAASSTRVSAPRGSCCVTATATSSPAPSATTPSTSRHSARPSRLSAATRRRSASSSSPTPSATRAPCCRRRAASAAPRAA